VALYDAEIRYCDEGIGQLLRKVEALGLKDNTVVVLLADHGEMMYRHGIFFDHHGLYEGNLRVPFMMRHPEYVPRRINAMTAHVDVAPTLADICGVEIPREMEGTSLVPWLRGERQEPVREFLVCQECTWQMKWALRTADHKFILARQPDVYGTPLRELYDLHTDPGEFHNVAEQQPERAEEMEEQLEAWIAEKMRQQGLPEDPLVTHGLSLGKEKPAQ